jgi:hypothetical protein
VKAAVSAMAPKIVQKIKETAVFIAGSFPIARS